MAPGSNSGLLICWCDFGSLSVDINATSFLRNIPRQIFFSSFEEAHRNTPYIYCWMLHWNILDPTVSVFDNVLTILNTLGHFCVSRNLM